MRALLRTPNNPRRHRSSVWRRCKGRPAIFSMLTRFAGAVSSGSDSCPVVRIRQGPVTRKGRVDRKQGAVLGRKSHCPQRGPCDGAAVRERDRPFGTAARERDRPFGTAVRERDRPFGTAARERDRPFGTAVRERDRPFGTAARERTSSSGRGESTGFADSGSLSGLSELVSHSRGWDTVEGLETFLGNLREQRTGTRVPRPGGAVPSDVSSDGRLDRTIGHVCGGERMSMGNEGMPVRCLIASSSGPHGRTHVRGQ